MLVFWVVTPTELEDVRTQYVPPKRRYQPASPHGVTIQKTNIDTF